MNQLIQTSSEEAVDIIQPLLKENRNILITGLPGTGKTFLANRLLELNPRIRSMAYTKMAASLLKKGKTFHSRYNLSVKSLKRESKQFSNKQTVMYDEISTLSIDLFEKLYKLNGPKTNYILMGDSYQLPPVEGYPLFDFLYNEKLCNPLDLVNIELTKIYRQKDDIYYQGILQEIRENGIILTNRVEKFIKERTNIQIPEHVINDCVYIAPLNKDVNKHNSQFSKYTP